MTDQVGPGQRRGRQEHARAQRHEARGAIGLARHDSANRHLGGADHQAIADGSTEPREEIGADQHAVARHEPIERKIRHGLEAPVERVRGIDRLQLDQQRASARWVARHRGKLLDSRDRRTVRGKLLELRVDPGAERPWRPHLDVTAEQRPRFASERPVEVRAEAPDARERGHAQRHARQEREELPPGVAGLAPRHPHGEAAGHESSATGAPSRSPTTRPSRSMTTRSA